MPSAAAVAGGGSGTSVCARTFLVTMMINTTVVSAELSGSAETKCRLYGTSFLLDQAAVPRGPDADSAGTPPPPTRRDGSVGTAAGVYLREVLSQRPLRSRSGCWGSAGFQPRDGQLGPSGR